MKAKVCILAAGTGSRLGHYSKVINKALLPLRGQAVISHIIQKFPTDTEFIIAVGYKSDQIINYLKLAHPEQNINFVLVENYSGPGSGPGLSALSCSENISGPFYFVSVDTLWSEDILSFPTDCNWVGVSPITTDDSVNYCNFLIKDDHVQNIYDKIQTTDAFAFIGLAYVKNADLFWKGLRQNTVEGSEKQISAGLQQLIDDESLRAYQMTWVDVGTEEKYVAEIKKTENFDFSKSKEHIYFVNNRVIKFYEDPQTSRLRVDKAKLNDKVFPQIEQQIGSFYSYQFQSGETLYKQTDPDLFNKLILWLDQNLWEMKAEDKKIMINMCKSFYQDKTNQRLEQYNAKYPDQQINSVNGVLIPSVNELLSQLDWVDLFSGQPSFMHGDLQPDNIIYDKKENQFLLLDWRQDFAGHIEFGDLYYDFAKLWGGLILNYDQIKQNKFSYCEIENMSCDITYPSHPFVRETQAILEKFIEKRKFSVRKTKILVGLIYLNMAPLHHYPFDKLLHALGRQVLNENLRSPS